MKTKTNKTITIKISEEQAKVINSLSNAINYEIIKSNKGLEYFNAKNRKNLTKKSHLKNI